MRVCGQDYQLALFVWSELFRIIGGCAFYDTAYSSDYMQAEGFAGRWASYTFNLLSAVSDNLKAKLAGFSVFANWISVMV